MTGLRSSIPSASSRALGSAETGAKGRRTGLADSTDILDMRMYDLLKYLMALEASSGVLNPT